MPYYAQYDPDATEPAPIIGWYDATRLRYPNLPRTGLLSISYDEWTRHFVDPNAWAVQNGALVIYTAPPPVPTADSILADKLSLGIAITSTDAPAISGTYALDSVTLDQIGAVARDFMTGLGLPFDAEFFDYPDATGAMHTFTGPEIASLYKAMRDMIAQLQGQAAVMRHGGTPAWPEQTATIM